MSDNYNFDVTYEYRVFDCTNCGFTANNLKYIDNDNGLDICHSCRINLGLEKEDLKN